MKCVLNDIVLKLVLKLTEMSDVIYVTAKVRQSHTIVKNRKV